jgi:hypothetical protein
MRVLNMKKRRIVIRKCDLLKVIFLFVAVCSIVSAGLVLAAGALWGWLRPFIHAWTG